MDTQSGNPQHAIDNPRWDRRDGYAIVALIVLWAFFFWRYFTPVAVDRVALPVGDFTEHFYVLRSFAYDQLRSGRFPLWGGEGVFSVYPFQADPESALFYPPAALNLLLWLALGRARFPLTGFQMEALGHVLLASVLTYIFLRGEAHKRSAAVLGSVAFAYGGYLVSYPLEQISFLEAAVWLPLALLGAKLLTQTGRKRYIVLTAVAFTLAFLPGNPQNLVFLFYTTLAYYLYRSWQMKTPWPVVVRRMVLVLLLTAGLSAVQLLPSVEWWRHSTRASIPFEQAAVAFPPQDIVQLVLTGLVSWWQPMYVGVLSLVLACLAGLLARRRDTAFWVALAIVALIFSLGKNVFGFEVAYLTLPGIGLFRDQERHAYLLTFALAVLAAYGADQFLSPLRRPARQWVAKVARWLRQALPMVFVLLLIAVVLHRMQLDPGDSKQTPSHVAVLWLALALTTLLFYLRLSGRGARRVMGVLLLLVLVFDLFSLNRAQYYAAYHDPHTVSPLWQQVLSDPGFFRVQEDEFPIIRDVAGRRQLRQVSGVAIRLAHYNEFLNRAAEDVRWKLMGVKYVVTWRGSLLTKQNNPVEADLLATEGEGQTLKHLYRLPDAPRPAWIIHDVVVAGNRDELYERLNAAGFDPFATAVLSKPVAVGPGDSSSDEVTLTHFDSGRVTLHARLGAAGLLVLGEVTYPGWRVYVNGAPARLFEADGVLRAVALPPGEWQVDFRFQPIAFYVGLAISLLTILTLIGSAVLARRRPA
jgi:hypothetical protein